MSIQVTKETQLKTFFVSKIEKVDRICYQEVKAIDKNSAIINAKESDNWKHEDNVTQSSLIHVESVSGDSN